MRSLCLVSVVVSLVVKSYNYSQLVLMWVVGIKQQILISVSGFPVNFNFQATPYPLQQTHQLNMTQRKKYRLCLLKK